MSTGNIKQLDYDKTTNAFKVTFKGGSTCEFCHVSLEAYEELLQMSYVERIKAVHRLIRDGRTVGITRGY
jgi:hypothetical protein